MTSPSIESLKIERSLKIHLPAELKLWLKMQAAANYRTMSAEIIVAVLERKNRIEKEDRS